MTYNAQDQKVDLTQLTRLYPAAIVTVGDEEVQVSLEWADMKQERVQISHYVLVFDIDPLGEVPDNRIELTYATKEALIEAMHEVAALLNS